MASRWRSSQLLTLGLIVAVGAGGAVALFLRTGIVGGGDEGEEGPRIDAPGIEADVVLVAPPEESAGEVPTFSWEPVEGATRYRLGVLDATGRLVWAWEGPETTVALGGVEGRAPEEGGPVIGPGSTWSVIAYDNRGLTVAVSEIRSVSP